jgi:predicted dehydrogenase
METVRVGVIGAGRMGQRHCRILSNLRRTELAGVFDTDSERGIQTAKGYSVPFCHSLEQLLDRCHAVIIAAPTPAHFETAMACLTRGRHMLIEKPIAETLAQAERLAAAAEGSGLVVQVGHIERFNPAYLELKNVLEALTPLAINLRRLSPMEGSNTDVDVVLDLMIHDTNLILDMMGREPAWVSGYGLTAATGQIDYATVHLAFDTPPIVNVTASRVTEHKIRAIEVTGREAYVECDLLNRSILVHRATIGEYGSLSGQGFKYRQESVVERIFVPNYESLFLEVQHFVECVLNSRPPAVSARDGLNSLRLALGIREVVLGRMLESRPFEPRLNVMAPAPSVAVDT